ncbi:MarR family transcriptional regulator [Aneurinibacillus sp. BA2021]|nr:MarR family transcriptional regulator [Aneurinibacillus sp. BA2021]
MKETKENDLLEELDYVFKKLGRRVTLDFTRRISPVISASQSLILNILGEYGPKKVSELAEELEITLPSITTLADKLVALGYIERKKSDKDRRIVYLHITEQGRQVVEELREERRKRLQKYYEALSEEDIRELIRIYYRMLAHLEGQCKKEGERS